VKRSAVTACPFVNCFGHKGAAPTPKGAPAATVGQNPSQPGIFLANPGYS
jgi:hypothetical protein